MTEATNNTTPAATQAQVAGKRKNTAKGKKKVAKAAEKLERLTVEYLKIDAVKPNDYNPNRQSEHDFELLLKSIEEDGFTQPVIIGKDNIIVDGEHRWRAAATLGYTEIPVVRVNMDAAQARISTIRHNRARGSHDIALEAEVLRDLQRLGALDWAADSLMMDDVELNKLINDIPVTEAMAAENFSEAWVPDSATPDERAIIQTASTELVAHAAGVTAMTAAGIEQQRQRELRLGQARTDQERAAVRADTAVFRLSLIFSGDEGTLVKTVLGNRPAEKILELCRAAKQ